MADGPPFGQRVRDRRRALDLTQEELARRVGCAGVTLRKIEGGHLRASRQIAERLAVALDFPLEEHDGLVRAARAVVVERGEGRQPTPTPPPLAPEAVGDDDLSGRAVRSYQLGERIGLGGFGAVYRAVQPGIARAVAIKLILPRFADHPDFIRRFEAEARLVARLEHPHIVPLYDYWRDPGMACLVMRYLRGGSLAAHLAAGPLAPGRALLIAEQVGAALTVAHRAGVVHRDLKPANILLDAEGNAFLADFGIAKDLGDAAPEQTGVAYLGSPAYSAPEQIQGEPATPQTDIYAFGVLLYELLTGRRPFHGPTPAAVIRQQLGSALPALAAARAGLPAGLDPALQRATAKLPADRHPDVASLLAELRAALAAPSEPVEVGAPAAAPAAPPTILLDLDEGDNPYKGLQAFDEADAQRFFGRETLVHRLLSRLSEGGDLARFLVVAGPSGSGKSSAVRAGLIPALRAGALPGSEQWYIVDMLPGASPIAELAAALRRVAPARAEAEDLDALLWASSAGLLRAVRLVLPPGEAELVLLIDQFEELFTLTASEAERAHLLDTLVSAALDERSRLRVVLTLRADFIDRPLQYADFGELLKQRSELVLPLTAEELERAVAGPARRMGLELEEGLAATIIADAGAQPGVLPLLQHALSELFARRRGRLLTLAAYAAIGGVTGALARSAEERFGALDAPERDTARQLFLRLVTPGEGGEDTRRRARRGELDAAGPAAAVERVLAVFGRVRLLTFDHDPATREPTVEVAHEALLRAWPRLRGWVDVARADLRTQRQLAQAAAEWGAAGQDPSYLAGGARLAQFAALAEGGAIQLGAGERAYLEAALAARAAQEQSERARAARELRQARALAETRRRSIRQLSLLAALLAVAVLASGGLGLYANTQRARADERTQAAQTAQAQADQRAQEAQAARAQADQRARVAYAGELAALGQAVRDQHPERGLLLAVEAMGQLREGDPAAWAAEQLIYDSLAAQPPLRGSIGDGVGNFVFVKLSPDGRLLLWGNVGPDNQGGPLRLWSLQDGIPSEAGLLDGFSGIARSGAFSSDRLVLTVIKNPTVVMEWLYDGQNLTPSRLNPLSMAGRGDARIEAETIGRSGRTLAAGADNGLLAVWDLRGEPISDTVRSWQGHPGWINSVELADDDQTLISAGGDGGVRLWDLRAPDPAATARALPTGGEEVRIVAVSADEGTLVGATDRGNVWVWDLRAPDLVASARVLRAGRQNIVTLALSADGRTLVTSNLGVNVRVWDLADPDPNTSSRLLRGHDAEVFTLALTPDGANLVTGSADATARVWDLRAPDLVASARVLGGHSSFVNTVTLDGSARTLATTSESGELRVWPFGPAQLLRAACRLAGRNLTWEEWQQYFGQQPYRQSCAEHPIHPSVPKSASPST